MSCPKAYELERIKKYPQHPAWWFIGGTLVHEATETFDGTFLETGQFVSLASDELTNRLDTLVQEEKDRTGTDPHSWFAAGQRTKVDPDTGEEIKTAGQGYDWWKEHGPEIYRRYVTWRTETQWPIAHFGGRPAIELSVQFPLAGMEMRGAPDRVFKYPSGDLVVADIKTGATIPKDPLQLGVYATALESLGYERPRWGTYILLKDGTVTPPVPLEKYDARYLGTIFGQTADNIARESFPPNVGDGCRQCLVQHACYATGGSLSHEYDPLDPNYQGAVNGAQEGHAG